MDVEIKGITQSFLTANGIKTKWKRDCRPDSGISQYFGSVGIALAKATRALARHVTFLHQVASLQSVDSCSTARQKQETLVEFSLSESRSKNRQ